MTDFSEQNVLYQDEHIIVCEKPVDLPVHKNDFMPNDAAYLTKAIGKLTDKSVYNVHRLDSKTSGVMVLAFSPEGAKNLTLQFERKEVEKTYFALVRENPREGTFNEKVLIKKKGRKKDAVTHFETIQSADTNICYKEHENISLSLVRINLETGRWHQIRQHFAMHRFDIIGDTHHGDWTLNRLITEKTGVKRLFLHAGALSFNHPVSNERMEFKSEMPTEFTEVLNFNFE